MGDETVDLEDVEVLQESDKALRVRVEGEVVWIPKSQIHDDSEVYSLKSSPGAMKVTRWIAEQKGLA